MKSFFYFGEVDRNQACHCERSCVKSESISIPIKRSQHVRSGRFRYDIRRNRWASEERTVTFCYQSGLTIGIFKALQSDWFKKETRSTDSKAVQNFCGKIDLWHLMRESFQELQTAPLTILVPSV